MIRNYLNTALRNLLRYKGYTLINILGLSLSVTACLVIGLFVHDEMQYDQFIKGGENIYRFYIEKSNENGTTYNAPVPPMFATHAHEYPEVENTARILMTPGRLLFEAGNNKTYENDGLFVDSTFFSLFPLQFLNGDPGSALNDPDAVVLTSTTAKKYFGTIDAAGKAIRIDNTDFIVSGVLADIPHFHLTINYLMPLSAAGLNPERMKSWGWQQFYTYVKLKPSANVRAFERKFQSAASKQLELSRQNSDLSYTAFLQPLRNIHLHSADFVYDKAVRGNITYIKGLTIIAIFLLLIACFNFINLATARSMRRAKEIGVRKVVGAAKKQIVAQFIIETIILSVVSVLIATVVTMSLIPALNNFTSKSISFTPYSHPILALLLLVAAIVVGAIAGIYPAFVMSAFQPIKVLKGLKLPSFHGSTATLRQSLVVLQFTLSTLLIISTLIVYQQINYLHKKDLGFDKEQVIYFSVLDSIGNNADAFKTELLRSPGVISATAGYGLPGDIFAGDGVKIPGKFDNKTIGTSLFVADYDYIRTLGLQLIAGRDFSKDHPTDAESAFIINETAIKEFGFNTPEKALGQKIHWDKWVPDSLHPVKEGRVIGVIKDFHYKSLYEKVNPAVLIIYPPVVAKVAVKVRSANITNTIADIKNTWSEFSPGVPLDYNFLDENFDKMYKSDEKLSGLLWIFTAVAIFVGCMGLFGLVALSAEQRVKEIGIRKVLGASAGNIIALLSKNFIQVIIVSLLIASPIAWWVMNKWLEDFAYKINIHWGVFMLAGGAALVIAMLTLSFQAIKAALANPVKNLRTE
jgi:putative ABC transport system permease protein